MGFPHFILWDAMMAAKDHIYEGLQELEWCGYLLGIVLSVRGHSVGRDRGLLLCVLEAYRLPATFSGYHEGLNK